MCRAAVVLLLLAGCRPRTSPEYVRELLAETPIPIEKLKDVLRVGPCDVQLVGGPIPSVLDYPSTTRWALRNVSARDLWIPRSELEVWVRVAGLLPSPPGCGYRPPRTIQRPEFKELEWVQLRPGQEVDLQIPAARTWGRATLSVTVGLAARLCCWDSASFNAGLLVDDPVPSVRSVEFQLGSSWSLPPVSDRLSPEELGGAHRLALKASAGSRFTLSLDLETNRDREALPLLAWAVSSSGELVHHGAAEVVAHSTSRPEDPHTLRVVTEYRIPAGGHRVLFAAPAWGDYSKFDKETYPLYRGGLSDWLPVLP